MAYLRRKKTTASSGFIITIDSENTDELYNLLSSTGNASNKSATIP